MGDYAAQLQTVLDAIEDERHLDADDIYTRLNSAVEVERAKGRKSKKINAYDELHSANSTVLTKLVKNAKILRRARSDLTLESDWTVAQTLFGITTSYRREANSTLSIKLEGTLENVPLFEQLSVFRETDLFHLWAPFTPRSRKLTQVTKIELVSWFIVSVPLFGLSRDAVFHAFGCDCMEKDGSILIVASSVDTFPGVDIPEEPKGWGGGRMIVNSFQGLVTITSPTSATTRLIANIDPRLNLPQKLIDFAMKKMCGVLLLCLQKMAKKVVKNPECQHARKIREDSSFYSGYLLPKFQKYCDAKGWVLPPVSSLEYAKTDLSSSSSSSSMSDISDLTEGTAGTGKSRGGSLYKRAKRKVGKRLKERRERRMDKEQIEILLEAEERNSKITVISPQLKARYNEWSSKKPDNWDGVERTTTDVVVELPIWGVLCYVGMMGGIEALDGIAGVGIVRMILTVILHVVCAGFLFTMGFSSLQGVESRRSGTLDTTKWFGCLVVSAVIGITSLFSAICCSSYTGVERYYMHVLRTHNYLPNPEAVPQYGDTYTWGTMAAKRHEKYLRWTCIAGALVYYVLTLLIKSNSEASVNLGSVANGFVERARQKTLAMAGEKKSLKQKLGICIGKGTLNKPKNLPSLEHTVINMKEKGKDKDKEQTKEERRKLLQEKLKQRRKSTAT